jgi:hypothetical protein
MLLVVSAASDGAIAEDEVAGLIGDVVVVDAGAAGESVLLEAVLAAVEAGAASEAVVVGTIGAEAGAASEAVVVVALSSDGAVSVEVIGALEAFVAALDEGAAGEGASAVEFRDVAAQDAFDGVDAVRRIVRVLRLRPRRVYVVPARRGSAVPAREFGMKPRRSAH